MALKNPLDEPNPDGQRFRSFAERYVIARAPHFGVGRELEDAWNATLDAKSIYSKIAATSVSFTTSPFDDAGT